MRRGKIKRFDSIDNYFRMMKSPKKKSIRRKEKKRKRTMKKRTKCRERETHKIVDLKNAKEVVVFLSAPKILSLLPGNRFWSKR